MPSAQERNRENAIAFYEHLGFEVLIEGFTLYGRPTSPTIR